MSRYWLILLLHSCYLNGINLRIRLYSTKESSKCIVSLQKGEGYLVALDDDDDIIDTIALVNNENLILKTLYFLAAKNNVSVSQIDRNLGLFKKISILSKDKETTYIIRYGSEDRTYQGNLIFYMKSQYIELLNDIDIERYIEGVVESEGGHSNNLEYLKAQAVLARTYAIKNINKFIYEGYNLTDDVRSQVYHNRCYLKNSKEIIEAVEKTKGLILFDKKGEVIDAVFHANSGGETVDPIHVWRTDGKEYLRPKKDIYSVGYGSYLWEKVVSREKYISFFKNYPSLYNDNNFMEKITNLKQGDTRLNVLRYNGIEIKLSDIRAYLKLRSSFFDITNMGNDNILIRGKGFGHGIGLSQDGAIKMAEKGAHYGEIINFYFFNIIMDNYSKIIK